MTKINSKKTHSKTQKETVLRVFFTSVGLLYKISLKVPNFYTRVKGFYLNWKQIQDGFSVLVSYEM